MKRINLWQRIRSISSACHRNWQTSELILEKKRTRPKLTEKNLKKEARIAVNNKVFLRLVSLRTGIHYLFIYMQFMVSVTFNMSFFLSTNISHFVCTWWELWEVVMFSCYGMRYLTNIWKHKSPITNTVFIHPFNFLKIFFKFQCLTPLQIKDKKKIDKNIVWN